MPAVLRVALPVPLMQVFDYLPPVGTGTDACARQPGARAVRPQPPCRRRRRCRRAIRTGRQAAQTRTGAARPDTVADRRTDGRGGLDLALLPSPAGRSPARRLAGRPAQSARRGRRRRTRPGAEVQPGFRRVQGARGVAHGATARPARARTTHSRPPRRPVAGLAERSRQPEAARTDRAGPPGKQRIVAHADRRSGAQRRAASGDRRDRSTKR